MKEIEILVKVYDEIDDCKKKLEKFNCKGRKEVVDIYYYDPLRDILKPNEKNEINQCMRLRKKMKKHMLHIK